MSAARTVRLDIRQAGQQILYVLAALAAVNLIFFMFYTRPKVREYRSLTEQNAPVFEALQAREEQVTARESYRDGVQKAQADLAELREILSTRSRRMVEVQSEVNRLAGQFQIPVDSVSYGTEVLIDEEFDRLAIDVPLEGGYAALRKFLQAVESSDKFLLVDRVSLSRTKEGGVMLSLNISLATYFNAPEDLIQRKRELGRRSRRSGA